MNMTKQDLGAIKPAQGALPQAYMYKTPRKTLK